MPGLWGEEREDGKKALQSVSLDGCRADEISRRDVTSAPLAAAACGPRCSVSAAPPGSVQVVVTGDRRVATPS